MTFFHKISFHINKENCVDTKECLEQLKYELRLKTDADLAEYLGVTPSALTKWKSRDELPYKWQVKIKELIKGNSHGIYVGKNNGSMTINTSSFNHSEEIKSIIELLQYAPSAYLDIMKQKLEQFKKMSEE